ncbi:MAG: NlpC/P60 family protein, partial [Mycobacterium sp.]
MSGNELSALSRAHQLFAGTPSGVTLDADLTHYDSVLQRAAGLNTGGGQELYQSDVLRSRSALRSAVSVDAALAGTATQAHRDHTDARALTKSVLDEARADTAIPTTPIAQREAVRRRAARLRAQQAHVLSARRQARRHRAALRALRYRVVRRAGHRAGLRLPPA